MIDKKLLGLLGKNKKYIFYTVALMIVGLIANIAITACICYAIGLASRFDENSDGILFIRIAVIALISIILRYITSRLSGSLKDLLGRKVKKDLRERVYNKIVQLGVRSADGMSMAGLTQVSMEGVEQLDLYYSSYIPQFFYAMIAPVILFCITVWIDWRVAAVLLIGVPLIPVSIIAVSKYAKKIFAKYWGKYTSMGDSFLDSVQGLRELKIFQADGAQHIKMKETSEEFRKITKYWGKYTSMGDSFLDSVQGLRELKIFQADGAQHIKMKETSEEFRKITMKVLIMQLASTTIMDLVAYGGAAIGIAIAVLE